MRPQIRANFWLHIASGVALVLVALSSPLGSPQTTKARAGRGFASRNLALALHVSEPILGPATPGRASIDADLFDLDEKDEDKSSWSLAHLDYPAFLPADVPRKALAGACPGSSARRTATVPLRC